MDERARWLMIHMHQLDTWRTVPYQALTTLMILSVSLAFCLIVTGCDVHEESSSDRVASQDTATRVTSIQEPEHASVRREAPHGISLPRIVAFGDSLTAGLGVPTDDAYPGQLAQWLRTQGLSFDVVNAGVSGETSAGGLRRVEWILKSQPKIVILELGANDGLRGQSLKDLYNNLKAIIERLQAKGVIVVLAGMQLPLNYGEDYTQEFSELYERLAKTSNVPFIPFFLEGVATHRDLNQGDGIHPTAEGYSIVVQNVWKALQPILTKLAQEG
jgi:acyl-CoA thioesterase-1